MHRIYDRDLRLISEARRAERYWRKKTSKKPTEDNLFQAEQARLRLDDWRRLAR